MSRQTDLLHKGSRTAGKHDAPEIEPIYLTNAFNVSDLDELDFVYGGGGFAYNRTSNPNRSNLGELISALEHGDDTLITNCGMSAISTALFAALKAGDHIVSDRTLYGETIDLINRILGKMNVEADYCDFTKPEEIRAALRPNTKVLYTETESNPMMCVYDLDMIAEIAHSAGAVLIVDNTFTTSCLVRPLDHGADAVVSSLTKFANGHGDTLAGSVTGSAEFIKEAYEVQQWIGTTADPFSSWLILRSMRTLDMRMARHCSNAMKVAEALERDPHVTKVLYPGLKSCPQHGLASRMMENGYGGMLSFFVPEDRAGINEFMHRLKYVRYAMTLGGPRTTISHPVTSSHYDVPEEERLKMGITSGMIRMSVGLEDPDDLVADLTEALKAFD